VCVRERGTEGVGGEERWKWKDLNQGSSIDLLQGDEGPVGPPGPSGPVGPPGDPV
jgi:hypothetical protein